MMDLNVKYKTILPFQCQEKEKKKPGENLWDWDLSRVLRHDTKNTIYKKKNW